MEPLHFEREIVTPSGTPLGGRVSVDLHDNGDYQVHFEMWSSSIFAPFDYNVRAYLAAPDFPTMAFLHSGHVDADDNDHYDEDGHSAALAMYWSRLTAAPSFEVAKDYSWGGLIGTLAFLVDDLVELFAGTVGVALGVVIGATKEAIGWMGATLGPGGTIGVIAGFTVFAVASIASTGIGVVAGLVTAVVVCVVTDLLIDSRPLNDAEKALARRVFADTIPLDDIVLTNLGGASGRGFTAQGVDGKIYLNIGKRFDNPLAPGGGTYPYPGQLLIHELVHAWQITHTGFLPGLMCDMLVTQADNTLGPNAYDYGPAGFDWSSDLNPEQQGAIVDQWFGASKHSSGYQPMDQQNVYYRYVWDDVLTHNPSATAPATLRSSTSSELVVVDRLPEQMDVFWESAAGALTTHWWNSGQDLGWDKHPVEDVSAASTGGTETPVAAVARTQTHLDLFCLGPAGEIVTQWWDGSPGPAGAAAPGWGHPAFAITAGGAARVDSPVAAVARTPHHLDAFWVDPNGAVITQWADDAPLSGWFEHPPRPVTAPGAVQLGSGLGVATRLPHHIDVFWVGSDGAVWTNWWDGVSSNGDWAAHGSFPITPPNSARLGSPLAAVARIPEHLDVFWIGPDGAVMTHWWDAAQGGNWPEHAPFPISAPGAVGAACGLSAVARGPLHLDVFWIDPQSAVITQAWDAGAPTGWLEHGPFPITAPHAARGGSPISAVSRAPWHLDVFWVGPDGAVVTHWWDSGPMLGWGDHPPFPISPPGAAGLVAATAAASAAGLTALSATLSAEHPLDSATAALRAVQVLQRVDPPTDATAKDYWFQLGNALIDLVVRLNAAGLGDHVGGPIGDAIDAYQHAAADGADPIAVAGLLRDLSIFATNASLSDVAVNAILPAADVLRGFHPAADQQEVYHRVFWNVLFDVFSRLVTAGRVAEAAAPASETVQELREWAAAGADVLNAADVLHTVSVDTAADSLLAPAIEAEQAAVDLLHAFQPPADRREEYLFFLARALFALATHLVAAQHPDQAADPAHKAVDVYRQLVAIADNPQYAGFLAEAEALAGSLAGG